MRCSFGVVDILGAGLVGQLLEGGQLLGRAVAGQLLGRAVAVQLFAVSKKS